MAEAGEQEELRIIVKAGNDGELTQFKIKPTTKMGKVFKAYSERKGIRSSTLRFLFDGEPVQDDQTARMLRMEDDDVIDAVLEEKEESKFTLKVTSGHSRLPNMAELWRSGQLCDAEIRSSDGQTFAVHKLVLASCSDYMRALLAEDRFKDSAGCPISLADTPSRTWTLLLEWMYEGVCSLDGLSDAVDLLEAASRVQCNDLVKTLGMAMSRTIKSDTCLGIWSLAERLQLETLADKAKRVALNNFDRISKSEDFKALSIEKLAVLLRDDLRLRGEKMAFLSIIGWANAQSNGPPTAEVLDRLLSCIRFSLIDEEFFDQHVQNEPLLVNNPTCFRTIARAFYNGGRKRRRIG